MLRLGFIILIIELTKPYLMKKIISTLVIILCLSMNTSQAQQEGFLGEVKLFAGNFVPRGWALCQGQLLSISQNQALFAIIGCTYGGDCRTTFALPDLRGRAPIGIGTGPGLSNRVWGQRGGVEFNYLNIAQLPAHNHVVQVIMSSVANVDIPVNTNEGDEDEKNPGAGVLANTGSDNYAGSGTQGAKYGGASIQAEVSDPTIITHNTGTNSAVQNMQPWLAMHYIICTQGIFPSRE